MDQAELLPRWTDPPDLAADHPCRRELESARRSGDIEPLLDTIAARYGVTRVAPAIASYVASSLHGGYAVDGFGLAGIQPALERPTDASAIFGRFEGPLPALHLGMVRGCPLLASVGSGRVISLHHDASLYEVAGRITSAALDAAMASLEALGSGVGITDLLALQAALAATFPGGQPSGPLYARVVLDVLKMKPAEARRRLETLPFEFLGLRSEDLDDLPKPGARSLPTKKPATAARRPAPPHPRVTRLLASSKGAPTSLDLSCSRLDGLPPEILALESLERLDLSGNPKLDLERVFEQLASLPRLAEVAFDPGESLPRSLAKLQGLTTLTLPRLNAADLEIAAALPRLRELRATGPRRAPDARTTEVLASPAFDRLESLTMSCEGAGPLAPLLAKKAKLERLELMGVCDADLSALSALPALRALRLSRAYEVPALEGELRRLELDRSNLGPESLLRLPRLEALLADQATGEVLPGLHPDARLTELSIQSWTANDWGPLRPRLGSLASLEVGGSDSKPSLLGPLGASDCPSLTRLDASPGPFVGRSSNWRFDDAAPLPRIEHWRVPAQPLPEWLRGSRARSVEIPTSDMERSLALALDIETIESISGSSWDRPFEVPPPGAWRCRDRLKKVRLCGSFARPADALAAIAAAPNLEELYWFLVPLSALPPALADRPLRSFQYGAARADEGPRLDLAKAFRLLGRTPLAELRLSSVDAVPEEIACLEALERVWFHDPIPPRLPEAALGRLGRLQELHFLSAKIVGPARKKLEKALPATSIRDAR